MNIARDLQEEIFIPKRVLRPLFDGRLMTLRWVIHLDDGVQLMAAFLRSQVVGFDHLHQELLVFGRSPQSGLQLSNIMMKSTL